MGRAVPGTASEDFKNQTAQNCVELVARGADIVRRHACTPNDSEPIDSISGLSLWRRRAGGGQRPSIVGEGSRPAGHAQREPKKGRGATFNSEVLHLLEVFGERIANKAKSVEHDNLLRQDVGLEVWQVRVSLLDLVRKDKCILARLVTDGPNIPAYRPSIPRYRHKIDRVSGSAED